jgi:hypothetical protein
MNFATECTSVLDHRESCSRNYTFRSMPRSSPRAQPELARENSAARVRRPAAKSRTKRLSKRVVQKPDGRYLIYFEKN